MFGLSAFGGFFGGGRFSCELRCYPVSFTGRDDLEAGNRLVLPPAALERLEAINAPSPMHFEVTTLEGDRCTHAGVIEFVAPDETCYMPNWMLQHMRAEEGDVLRIVLKQLPKATFARLQPASIALLRVCNPRALLESGLKNFVALTVGDSFSVEYDGQKYGIEVLEVRPGDAVSIIDTDVEVEFATPKDAEAAAARLASSPSPRAAQAGGASSSSSPARRSLPPAPAQPPAEEVPRAVYVFGRRIEPDNVVEREDTATNGEDLPWKRRIPQGVKWTTAPYGCDKLRLVGEASRFGGPVGPAAPSPPATSSSAAPRPAGAAGAGSATSDARARALQAAEARYAMNAEEIERRRREEQEAKERERAREEEEARQKSALEARKRKLQAAGQSAPAQQQMTKGGAKSRPAAAAEPARRGGCCCCCIGGGRTAAPASARI